MTEEASNKKTKAFLNVTATEISLVVESIANNVDLLTEILLRLPVKSIIRLKSVSKHWLSLLSDSEFANIHFTRSSRPSSISGLYFYTKETLHSVSLQSPCLDHLPSLSFLDGVRQQSKIEVEDSCNGLLLCLVKPHDDNGYRGAPRQYLDASGCDDYYDASGCDDYYNGYEVERYIVWNPTTKKYTIIPDILEGDVWVWRAYLAFDPAKSPRHYKLVLVTSSTVHHEMIQIIVYSSQSLCWRKVIALPEKACDIGRGVFWNGAIHWLTNDGFVKRFDVDFEKIIAMKNPQKPRILRPDPIRDMYFGECGGSLILIQSTSWRPSRFRILELESDYSGWVVKCKVNLDPIMAQFPTVECRVRHVRTVQRYNVLYALEGENGRGCVLLFATPWRIISYNLKDKTLEVLGDLPLESREFGLPGYGLPFVESLFL